MGSPLICYYDCVFLLWINKVCLSLKWNEDIYFASEKEVHMDAVFLSSVHNVPYIFRETVCAMYKYTLANTILICLNILENWNNVQRSHKPFERLQIMLITMFQSKRPK